MTNRTDYRTNPEVLKRIVQKVRDEEQKSILQNVKITELKAICKRHGIKGYSGKTKASLSKLIVATMEKKELEDLVKRLKESLKKIKYGIKYFYSYKENLEKIIQADKLLQSQPEEQSALKSKIWALATFGETDEIIRYYDILLDIEPGCRLLEEKADIYFFNNRFEEAVLWYTKAIETNYEYDMYGKCNGDYIRKKAEALIKLGKNDAAKNLLKNALDDDRAGIKPLRFLNEDGWEEYEKMYKLLIALQIQYEDEDAVLSSYINWGDQMESLYRYHESAAFLGKGIYLIKKGRLREAQDALDIAIQGTYLSSYSASNEINLKRKVLLHKARIAAFQGDQPAALNLLHKIISVASDTYSQENLLKDTKPYCELDDVSFHYSTGKYYHTDEKEKINERTKLREVSKMFSPLDRWFKREE